MTGSHLKKWRELPFREKILLARFVFCLPWISFSIRLFGYSPTRNFLSRLARQTDLRQANAAELAEAQRTAELLLIAGRHGLISATCLRQSVLLEYWLKRRGLAAEIKIGVRKEQDLFDAHAWIELNGLALAQDSLEHHHVMRDKRAQS
jgi:hypothetical protein